MTGILPATRGRGVIGSMLGIPDILLFARTVHRGLLPCAACCLLELSTKFCESYHNILSRLLLWPSPFAHLYFHRIYLDTMLNQCLNTVSPPEIGMLVRSLIDS